MIERKKSLSFGSLLLKGGGSFWEESNGDGVEVFAVVESGIGEGDWGCNRTSDQITRGD
jgi:hypothetical protein